MKSIRFLSVPVLIAGMICGCATLGLREPEVRRVRPRITGIDFTGITLAFDVDVYNPNIFRIRAPRLRYAFLVEGSRLFGAETISPVDLPQNDLGMISFPVRVSYFDLYNNLRSLAHLPEANYRLDGGFLLPAGPRTLELPFSHSGTFPILRPPKISDVTVDVAEPSLFRTRIQVNAFASNPNVFPLGIENLGYTLKLGDRRIADLAATARETLKAGETVPLSFSAEVSTASTLLDLLRGGKITDTQLQPYGAIETPYGAVKLR
mgnify:CR=1 FL=1